MSNLKNKIKAYIKSKQSKERVYNPTFTKAGITEKQKRKLKYGGNIKRNK